MSHSVIFRSMLHIIFYIFLDFSSLYFYLFALTFIRITWRGHSHVRALGKPCDCTASRRVARSIDRSMGRRSGRAIDAGGTRLSCVTNRARPRTHAHTCTHAPRAEERAVDGRIAPESNLRERETAGTVRMSSRCSRHKGGPSTGPRLLSSSPDPPHE